MSAVNPLDSYPEPGERIVEYSAILALVSGNFEQAQQKDMESGQFRFVTVERDVEQEYPLAQALARFRMTLKIEPYIEGHSKNSTIDIIIPVDEHDAKTARSLLTLDPVQAVFHISNPSSNPEQFFQVSSDSFEELFSDVQDVTRSEPADVFDESYMGILANGEFAPLRSRSSDSEIS